MKNLYEALGIKRTANMGLIREAIRDSYKRHIKDDAIDILLNEERKHHYDTLHIQIEHCCKISDALGLDIHKHIPEALTRDFWPETKLAVISEAQAKELLSHDKNPRPLSLHSINRWTFREPVVAHATIVILVTVAHMLLALILGIAK